MTLDEAAEASVLAFLEEGFPDPSYPDWDSKWWEESYAIDTGIDLPADTPFADYLAACKRAWDRLQEPKRRT